MLFDLLVRFQTLLKYACHAWLLAGLSSFSTAAKAGPWIDPGDMRTRHHLQVLVDSGAIRTPITTWPLMWSNLRGALDEVNATQLSKSALWSFQYLKHALRQAQTPVQFSSVVTANSQQPVLTDFNHAMREQYGGVLNANFTGQRASLNVRANYHRDPTDDEEWRADGSYFSYLLGNWAVGVGAIDRWWGPGWENSLILSHNARPTPGIFLQRNNATPFKTPWLRWLGPWQLTTFMNQFEHERPRSNARLWGMRVSFRPLQSLEVGLSRTAMWAGEGRPGDADSFIRLLLGRDNRGDNEVNEDNEPGNQLAGFDVRWSMAIADYGSLALYGQLIGEDEANGTPSRHIGMAGAEFSTYGRQIQHRFVLEAANTTVYFYNRDRKRGNVAYEHPLYPNGYRHYGRPLGASMDNDGESIQLRYQAYFDNGHALEASFGKYRLNADGSNGDANPGNIFGAAAQDVQKLDLRYSLPISKRLRASAGISALDEELSIFDETSKTRAFLTLESLW